MTTITALPPPPTTTDPTNFNSRANTFLAALPTFVTETNTVASEVVANRDISITQAGLATTNGAAQVALATTQAGNAATSATAAAASLATTQAVAAYKGLWSTISAANLAATIPYCVYDDVTTKTYWQLDASVGSGTIAGFVPGISSHWLPAAPTPSIGGTVYAYQSYGGF